MRPIVNTEKHIVQRSLFAVASGAIVNTVIVKAVAVPATASEEVREGSKISAVYFEFWVTSDDATAGTSVVTVAKVPGDGSSMTVGESGSLNVYTNKKNIFLTQMGLLPPNTQYPMAVIKGWVKIPKSKQRFGLNDQLHINFHGQSNGMSVCGFALYKEQF